MCRRQHEERGSEFACQALGGRRIERAVVEVFLEAVRPAGIEVALIACQGLQEEQEKIARHWRQQIERAEYEAEVARRRFEAVDATNRLVAAELERCWNEALARVEVVRRESGERLDGLMRELSEIERQRVRRMAEDVGRIWNAPTTTPADRKRLLRAAIERVVLTAGEHTVKVGVEWKGGELSEIELKRLRRGEPVKVTDQEVVELVRRLAMEDGLDDNQVARVLARRGMRTAMGLTFTKLRVKSVRAQYEILRGEGRAVRGERCYTAEEAAREMEVSGRTLHEWLRTGLLRGKQIAPAPWRIQLDEETRRRLAGADAPEGWVGIEEAASCLGVSKQTVATWVKCGKLQAVRVARGRRQGWRIRVDSVGSGGQTSLPLTQLQTPKTGGAV